MKTTRFIACVKEANNIKANKRNVRPVILDPVWGTTPRGINVLDGTVAKNNGIECNKAYMFKAIELEPNDKGFNFNITNRQFNFSKLIEVSGKDLLEYMAMDDMEILVDSDNDTWVKPKAKTVETEDSDETEEPEAKPIAKKKAKATASTEEPEEDL